VHDLLLTREDSDMKKKLLTSILFLAISMILISSAFAGTDYTSSLEFNHAIADFSGSRYFNGAIVKLIFSNNTVALTGTLNSTGGYKWDTGIGNGTRYYLAFYWQGELIYNGSGQTDEGFDFTTNNTAGASNKLTLQQQNLTRYALTSNTNLWAYLQNSTGVSFKSASYGELTKELVITVTAPSGNVSIIKVYHGTDLQSPQKVFVNGQDITAFRVSNATDDEFGRYTNCWYYDAGNRVIWLKGTHSSDIEYKIEFAPSVNIPPQQPWGWTITIFDQRIPVLLLACAILLLIALIGGAYLIIAGRS
jgi:hypothetical protein